MRREELRWLDSNSIGALPHDSRTQFNHVNLPRPRRIIALNYTSSKPIFHPFLILENFPDMQRELCFDCYPRYVTANFQDYKYPINWYWY